MIRAWREMRAPSKMSPFSTTMSGVNALMSRNMAS
jgi:hypothetical protein